MLTSFIELVGFEICGLFICLFCLYLMSTQKYHSGARKKLYRMILYTLLAYGLCSIMSNGLEMLDPGERRFILQYYSKYLVFVCKAAISPMVVMYLLEYQGILTQKTKLFHLIIMIPFIITEVFALSNPATHALFYYEGYTYYRGDYMDVIYLNVLFYFILGIAMTLSHGKVSPKDPVKAIIICVVAAGIGSMIQSFSAKYMLALFFESICMLGLYIVIEDENSSLDPVTELYGKERFLRRNFQNMQFKRHYSIIEVDCANLNIYRRVLSLDHFNKLLKVVATKLVRVADIEDIFVYRTGKFLLVYDEKDELSIQVMKEKTASLYNDLSEYITVGEMTISLSYVLRIIRIPDNCSELKDLVQMIETDATINMGHIKVIAGKKVEELSRVPKIERKLHQLIREEALPIYFEPIWSEGKQGYVAVKVSLGFHDQELGRVDDSEISPIVEKNGMVIEVGEYLVRKTAEFIQTYHPEKYGVTVVEMKLSVYQLYNAELIRRFHAIMLEHQVPKNMVKLSVYLSPEASREKDNLDQLYITMRRLGYSFVLDDYGEGNSNLAQLLSDKYEYVKIYGDFFEASMYNKTNEQILAALVDNVKENGMIVVAKGVDSEELRDYAHSIGVTNYQGKVVGGIMTEEEYASLLTQEQKQKKGGIK